MTPSCFVRRKLLRTTVIFQNPILQPFPPEKVYLQHICSCAQRLTPSPVSGGNYTVPTKQSSRADINSCPAEHVALTDNVLFCRVYGACFLFFFLVLYVRSVASRPRFSNTIFLLLFSPMPRVDILHSCDAIVAGGLAAKG